MFLVDTGRGVQNRMLVPPKKRGVSILRMCTHINLYTFGPAGMCTVHTGTNIAILGTRVLILQSSSTVHVYTGSVLPVHSIVVQQVQVQANAMQCNVFVCFISFRMPYSLFLSQSVAASDDQHHQQPKGKSQKVKVESVSASASQPKRKQLARLGTNTGMVLEYGTGTGTGTTS